VGLVVLLPGVPIEMRNLLAHEVVPRLATRLAPTAGSSAVVIRSSVVRTTGLPESTLAERLGDIEAAVAPLTLAYLPDPTGVDLRLTAWRLPADEADRRLQAGVRLLRDRAGVHAYGEGAVDLAAVVLEQLRTYGLRLAVAESCTGGLLGGRLTEIAGSSDVFVGGIIAYADRLKIEALGVSPAVLDEHGAVSEAAVRAMAEGAAARFGVDATVAVTGIAGPTGATTEKPVGTVWFGTTVGGTTEAKLANFPGDRRDVRIRAAQYALFLLYRRLLSFGQTLGSRSASHEQQTRE
jgi:nicotinamide-nucleotide amidase